MFDAESLGRVSRRHFLMGGAAVAGAAALPAGAWAQSAQPSCVPDADWKGLAGRLKGRVLRPGDAGFDKAALPNNLRYACVRPAGIAQCATPEDVQAALSWAREMGMALVARSGGHSYAGFSTTHGLMIDMRGLKSVALDRQRGEVTVGGGIINSHLYEALAAAGLAITHGRCPTVGGTAFVLGGGIGFNMRANGMACDQLVKTDLVMADGSLRTAREGDNSLLFWALRGGGGGNFGLNTSLTLRTFPVAGEMIEVFNLTWTDRIEAVAPALMAALHAAPVALGSRVSFQAPTLAERRAGNSGLKINLVGQYRGSREAFLDLMAPVYRIAKPDPQLSMHKRLPYWAGQHALEEEGEPTYYQERSAFVRGAFPDAALAEGLDFLRKCPGTNGTCDLRFFQTGGKINAVAPDVTAFVHRRSDWLMVVGLYWDAADNRDRLRLWKNHVWQNQFYHAMLKVSGVAGAYQNFPDPSLADWRIAYYGDNLARLSAIKAAHDPDNVFQFPQAL